MPSLKACLFLRRSKKLRPWTDMRRTAWPSCSPFTFSIISAEKPAFFLLEILERIPDIFFFLPQTNKHSGICERSLRGNDMFAGVLGSISQRFNDPQVGLNHGGRQKSLGLGSEKTNVTGKKKKEPVFNGLSNCCESGQVDLIKAPVKFTP